MIDDPPGVIVTYAAVVWAVVIASTYGLWKLVRRRMLRRRARRTP